MSETPDHDEPVPRHSRGGQGPEEDHEDTGSTVEIEPAADKTPKLPGTAEHPEPHVDEVAGAD